MSQSTGKIIIIIGIALVIIGVILYFFHNKLQWLGKLPGDIRIEREGFRFYFPIATMIVISIIINLIIQLIKRF